MIIISGDKENIKLHIEGTPAQLYAEATGIMAALIYRLSKRFNNDPMEVSRIIGRFLPEALNRLEEVSK